MAPDLEHMPRDAPITTDDTENIGAKLAGSVDLAGVVPFQSLIESQ